MRCRRTKTETCGWCEARISAAEDRRAGYYSGYSDRELDDMADAQAARDWANRGES